MYLGERRDSSSVRLISCGLLLYPLRFPSDLVEMSSSLLPQTLLIPNRFIRKGNEDELSSQRRILTYYVDFSPLDYLEWKGFYGPYKAATSTRFTGKEGKGLPGRNCRRESRLCGMLLFACFATCECCDCRKDMVTKASWGSY